MVFGLLRPKRLDFRLTPCPSRRRKGGTGFSHLCPSCLLPLVVCSIFTFTFLQLALIHRTIEGYRERKAAEADDCLYPNESRLVLTDLVYSRQFSPVWPNVSLEWDGEQTYPFKILQKHPTDSTWRPLCPYFSPLLKGERIEENENIVHRSGGKFSPETCNPRARVAIIIPYRDRKEHLESLLSLLHPMLQRQLIAYRIFVIEQWGNLTFNKGVLLNAGFLLAMNTSAFDCLIFHDVDLLPMDDRNIYSCGGERVRHLSVAVDTLDFKLPYESLVGGVFALTITQFIKVNGYSNLYWGWGAEDDDMSQRLLATRLRISRPDSSVARYKMLGHVERPPSKVVSPLLRTARLRYQKDGLTSLKFKLIEGEEKELFTRFLVDVGRPSLTLQKTLTQLAKGTLFKSKKEASELIINPITP